MGLLSFIKGLVSEKEGLKEYREELAKFISDAKVSDIEKQDLELIFTKYDLTPEEIIKLQRAAMSDYVQNMFSDQRVTEEERQALEVLLNYFGLQPSDIAFDQRSFNKFYSLALIDKGILPEIKPENYPMNILLKPEERVHYASPSELRKFKRVTTRVNYGGLTGSIRIMKGIRYRVGSIAVGRESQEVLATIDQGTFYITNQKVGYIGNNKQFTIAFNKIHSFDLRGSGIYIFKEGKESPYIIALGDYELPSSIVSFIINQDT